MGKKISSLFELASEAAQDGIRMGVGDVFKQGATALRKQMVKNASGAVANVTGRAAIGDPADMVVDPSTGAPQWVSKLLAAPFGVHLVIGDRGEGKTSACLALGEARGRDVFMLDAPETLRDYVGTVDSVPDIRKVPEGATVIIDDASRYIGSRRAMSKANVEFGEIIATARHRGLTLAINSQYASWVDRYALEVTAYWQKYPAFGWQEIERPFLHQMVRNALAGYEGMGELERKKWVYLWRNQAQSGMMSYSPPAWYTTQMSRFRGKQGGGQGSTSGRFAPSDDGDGAPVLSPDSSLWNSGYGQDGENRVGQ